MNAKTTATELPKATNDQKPAAPIVASASPSAAGPIKNASMPISSKPTAETAASEGNADNTAPRAATKMEIATEIYQRMSKQKDVTRKQIVEQFVTEAKLSAAGASTYYQLIKAKAV